MAARYTSWRALRPRQPHRARQSSAQGIVARGVRARVQGRQAHLEVGEGSDGAPAEGLLVSLVPKRRLVPIQQHRVGQDREVLAPAQQRIVVEHAPPEAPLPAPLHLDVEREQLPLHRARLDPGHDVGDAPVPLRQHVEQLGSTRLDRVEAQQVGGGRVKSLQELREAPGGTQRPLVERIVPDPVPLVPRFARVPLGCHSRGAGVMAPSEADCTSAAYLAKTPLV